jgi:uncharacterized membrane protein YbaN (DUF454 family)
MKRPPGDVADPARARFRYRVQRLVLLACAWIFLALGIAGVFLPLLPGTLFLIIAAACFTRSSPAFEAWLLDHPRFGPPVRQWRASGIIPRRAKWFACISLVVSWCILLVTEAPTWVVAGCLVVFVAVALYIVSRPE